MTQEAGKNNGLVGCLPFVRLYDNRTSWHRHPAQENKYTTEHHTVIFNDMLWCFCCVKLFQNDERDKKKVWWWPFFLSCCFFSVFWFQHLLFLHHSNDETWLYHYCLLMCLVTMMSTTSLQVNRLVIIGIGKKKNVLTNTTASSSCTY